MPRAACPAVAAVRRRRRRLRRRRRSGAAAGGSCLALAVLLDALGVSLQEAEVILQRLLPLIVKEVLVVALRGRRERGKAASGGGRRGDCWALCSNAAV